MKLKLNLIYKFILTFAAPLAFFGCSQQGEEEEVKNEDEGVVSTISFTRAPRYAATGIDSETEDTSTAFGEGSIIYVSQMGTYDGPNFTQGAPTNLYQYQWYENEGAQWENDQYNFEAVGDPISWNTVKNNGQVGNSFSLYGMYFPVNQTIRFNVETNQTLLENFRISDILGAYHSTSSLYTRLRMRFFHLMVYLKVTLYVPVYQINANGDESTGYEEGALTNAYVIQPFVDFNVDWRANRTSDTEAPLVTMNSGTSKSNIYMYLHSGSGTDTEVITVSSYYNGGSDTDTVRAYEFSVLFPPQSFNGNILCFQLQTPGQQNGAPDSSNAINYYFSSSQLTTETNDFRFVQGTLQHLSLYLPRHANETVLLGAEIIDWTEASTGMTVVEQTGSEQGGSNN